MELLDVPDDQGAKDDVLDFLLNLVTFDTSLKMARRPHLDSSVYEEFIKKGYRQYFLIRI